MNASSTMPMFSTGSRSAIPPGNLRLTSLTLLSAWLRASTGLRSLARKMRMCEMPSSVERRTGTTANSPSSAAPPALEPDAVTVGHGRIVLMALPGDACLFLPVTEAGAGAVPLATCRSTSTMYWFWGGSSAARGLPFAPTRFW